MHGDAASCKKKKCRLLEAGGLSGLCRKTTTRAGAGVLRDRLALYDASRGWLLYALCATQKKKKKKNEAAPYLESEHMLDSAATESACLFICESPNCTNSTSRPSNAAAHLDPVDCDLFFFKSQSLDALKSSTD